jgi:putative ABC transport system permease protein
MTQRRSSAEHRLDLEIRDHIERQVADYVASGMSEPEARRRVRLEFGGLDQAKEYCRDVRPHHWFSELLRDIRIGFRGLRRERLFAGSIVLILALAIGASVAMFSVVNAVILRPLPYARPGELAVVATHLMTRNRFDGTSLPNFLDWRAQSRTFAGMTFYRRTAVSAVTFAGRDAPQRGLEGLVGPEFFSLLGTPPLIGRTPSQAEFDRKDRVVMISEGLWQEQFARSADVLGTAMTIDGQPHTIIGVMPHDFQLPTRDTRLWRPISTLPFFDMARFATLGRDGDAFEVIGRLAPGVRLDEAQAEMRVIARRLREQYSDNADMDVRVTSLFDHVVGSTAQRGVWLGFTAVLALLAIACANVGGLLLVRATRRRQEFQIRTALGAGRGRLVRQLLAESISLWAIASVSGLLLSIALIRLLIVYGPSTIPRMEQLGLDATAVAVALLGGLVVVTLCGTLPSLIAGRTDGTGGLATRDESSSRRPRLQDLLVAGQIAGALVLLVTALLFAQSFVRANSESPGYAAANLMIVRIDLPRSAYPDSAFTAAFFREARQRIARLPGVVAVGGVMDFFLRRNADQRVTIEGRVAPDNEQLPRLTIELVTPGFFDAIGAELIAGREFTERDLAPGAPPVFIVGESMARRFWPGQNPVGKRMVSGRTPRKDGRWDAIVGVVKDLRREGRDVEPILTAFIPANMSNMDLTVRASTDVTSLIPAVRQALRDIDPSVPLTQITAVNDRLSERLSGRRFESQVLVLFAAIGLSLAAAGLYALLAYQVALRTREIGIRSALGADERAILSLVLTHAARLTLGGVMAGIVGASWASSALQSLLYNTKAIDAASYAVAVAAMLVIAVTAAGVPALRAARINPMIALREG